MQKQESIVKTLLLIVLVSITGVLGLGLPIVALVYPIILTFIALQQGLNKSIIAFVSSLIVIGLITQSLDATIIPLQYGILSVVTTILINKKYPVSKIILYSSSLVFLMVLVHMGLRKYFTGINTFMELENSLANIAKQQIDIVRNGDMSESEISQMSNLLKNVSIYISSIIPALLLVTSTAIAYINFYASVRLSKKAGRRVKQIPKFSEIIFPRSTIKGFAMILVLSYALKYVDGINYIQLLDNIFVILFSVFIIEGLSLTIYLINKMKIGRLLKVVFIVIIILSSFLNIVLFSLGVIDIILDFRKLRQKDHV